jgi:hypothetical protein
MTKWILLLLLGYNSLLAQPVSFTGNKENPVVVKENFKLVSSSNTHQYLTSKWAKGRLFYLNGTSKPYDSLNLDRHSNKLEVVANNKILALLPMGLSGVLIATDQLAGSIIIVAVVNGESKFALLESYGDYLLASFIEINEPIKNHTYANDEIRFVAKEKPGLVVKEHYMVLMNGNWEVFKISKSAIGKLFKVDKKEIQSIASKAGISINNQNGLLQLYKEMN